MSGRVLATLAAGTLCAGALALVLLPGCASRGRVVYDRPEIPSGYWEKAWVEPRIIIADTLLTLIRAERVDSIWTDTGDDPQPDLATSLEFFVPHDSCFVAIAAHYPTQARIGFPLVVRHLDLGYYKLTPTAGTPVDIIQPGSIYLLRAEVCGRTYQALMRK